MVADRSATVRPKCRRPGVGHLIAHLSDAGDVSPENNGRVKLE